MSDHYVYEVQEILGADRLSEPTRWRLKATTREDALQEALEIELPLGRGWVSKVSPVSEAEWLAASEREASLT